MNILLSIIWDVKPTIFSIGSFELRYYGLFFASGLAVSYIIMKYIFGKESLLLSELDKFSTYIILGAVLGARFGHILFYEPAYYFSNPIEILKVWHGGLASHGGTLGIVIAAAIYSRKYKLNFIWLLDRLAIVAAISSFFIRMGNLMNSEIYGTATELPWGMVFVLNGEEIAKHPTQIYEALSYLVIFLVLFFLYRKYTTKTPKGLLVGFLLSTVFFSRFLIEFIKNPQTSFEQEMTLNMGQWLSIPFVVAGLSFLVYSWLINKKAKD